MARGFILTPSGLFAPRPSLHCCWVPASQWPRCHPAIRLRGGRVTGRLDLMGATITYALVCEHCRFDEPIRLVEATTKTVRIVDSQLPGFNGARMRADGIINLHHSEVAAVLRLDGARISGELCLDDATLGSGTSDVALAAENLAVDGPLNCRGIVSRGAISLRGAHISGTVDATAAKITTGKPKALDANFAVIGGRFRATAWWWKEKLGCATRVSAEAWILPAPAAPSRRGRPQLRRAGS